MSFPSSSEAEFGVRSFVESSVKSKISNAHFSSALGAALTRNKIRLLWQALFEWSELRSHLIWCQAEGCSERPRTGGYGFGSFCRNKRISSAGTKPRKEN